MHLNRTMIFVKDLGRMTAFYKNPLGLPIIEATRQPNYVEFATGAAIFSLHSIPGDVTVSTEPRETHPIKLSFEVPNAAAEHQRLESLGVPLLHRPWGAYDFVDPEGNVIGIHASS